MFENQDLDTILLQDNKRLKLIFVDVSAFIYRYYFAAKKVKSFYNNQSIEVGALQGYLDFIHKLSSRFHGTIIHVLDNPFGSFYRKNIFPEYKNRPPKEPELQLQIDLLPKVLSGYNQFFIQIDGIESDDIIAKYAEIYGVNDFVMIVGEDKDIWQNLCDERYDGNDGVVFGCRYSKNKNGFNDFDLIFPDFVFQKYGVHPHQMADYLALVGDVSDNIPGVKGIGDKSAVDLLNMYGNITQILEEAKLGNIKGAKGKNLINYQDNLFLSKKLTLAYTDFDVPLIEDFSVNQSDLIRYEAKNIVPSLTHWNF